MYFPESSNNSNSKKLKANCEKYLNSSKYIEEMNNLKKNIRKRKHMNFFTWIKSNILSLVALLISIIALVFTILSYLTGLH